MVWTSPWRSRWLEAEPQFVPHMTAAEFMAWDGGGHIGKLELVNGEVRAMSPASGTVSVLKANLAALVGGHIRFKILPLRVGITAPIQPRMHANDNVRAPDLAVTGAPPSSAKVFPDPVLIVEVLSPSNHKETWDSIYAMATIPTLNEIVVVHSEKMPVEVLKHGPDGAWPKVGEVAEVGGTMKLTSISAEFPVVEIYVGTHLA